MSVPVTTPTFNQDQEGIVGEEQQTAAERRAIKSVAARLAEALAAR